MHQHNVPSPFHALFSVLNDKKAHLFITFIQLELSNYYTYFNYYTTIDANDNLNQNFVYFMGVLIASFFLMLCEVNIAEIFISI